MRKSHFALAAAGFVTIVNVTALAADYPRVSVKIITQIGAGNGPDIALRVVADQLGKLWKQQAIVINQPGAGGLIAARNAAAAAPDGSTLFMAVASTFVALPKMQQTLSFEVNQFEPIGFVGEVPMVLAASPSLPVNSVADLVSLSRQRPAALSIATTPRGDITHLSLELFRERSGADLTVVHYQTMAQAMNDVIPGRVAAAWEGIGGPSAKGQLKLLGVAAPSKMPSRPDLPTVAETVPGFVATGWWVLVAPHGTPAEIVNKLSSDLRTVLVEPEVQQKFEQLGTLTRLMTPQQLADFIASERRLWTPVIDKLGVQSPGASMDNHAH